MAVSSPSNHAHPNRNEQNQHSAKSNAPNLQKPRPSQRKQQHPVKSSQSITLFEQNKRAFWWRRLPDVDPISLEPLKRLRYEPFGLASDDQHQTYFDGKVLAEFLIASASFIHPLSRRDITLEDCERLDQYLQDNKLKRMNVVEAFNNRNADTTQEERNSLATAVLLNFYEASSFRSQAQRHRADQFRSQAQREEAIGALRALALETNSAVAEDVDSPDPATELEQNFPSLSSEHNDTHTSQMRIANINWGQGRTVFSQNNLEQFPTLGGDYPVTAAVRQAIWHVPRETEAESVASETMRDLNPPAQDDSVSFPALGGATSQSTKRDHVRGDRNQQTTSQSWSNVLRTETQQAIKPARRLPNKQSTKAVAPNLLTDFPSLAIA